jgi:enoyl-[acyl-carrier protein] reductase I
MAGQKREARLRTQKREARLGTCVPTIHVLIGSSLRDGDARRSPGMTKERAVNMQGLMQGKRGLIMGVANDHSIAWGIAKTLAAHGAELAFTYQGEALGKRVKPLAQSLNADLVLPCDVENIASVDAVFETLRKQWGGLDFLVHAIGFSDKNELKGRYADTTRENFSRTMIISCFSFTELARRAAALMPASGGAMITLTYGGSTKVMPNYNVMGVAKAALEASVRYLASDFGRGGIRVNAISAGPVRTLAGAVIGDSRAMFAFQQKHAPLGRGVTLDELGGSALYLLSDLSTGVTGEIHFVDSGYNIISMPRTEDLKAANGAESAKQRASEAAK